jgi:hypothetical protein
LRGKTFCLSLSPLGLDPADALLMVSFVIGIGDARTGRGFCFICPFLPLSSRQERP